MIFPKIILEYFYNSYNKHRHTTESHTGSIPIHVFPLPYPVQCISVPQAPQTHQSSSLLLEICITVHSDGIAGIFHNFARFLLIIHNSAQLSLPDRSISWPKHQKWSLLVPLPCWIFVSELLLIFSKSIFFICLLFNCLSLQFSLEFKLHENREFVYFAMPPAPGTMAGT